jgi:hypothetical protein
MATMSQALRRGHGTISKIARSDRAAHRHKTEPGPSGRSKIDRPRRSVAHQPPGVPPQPACPAAGTLGCVVLTLLVAGHFPLICGRGALPGLATPISPTVRFVEDEP